jgi:hypothetical protein
LYTNSNRRTTMRRFTTTGKMLAVLLLFGLLITNLNAQQLKITDFVLFGGQNATGGNIVTTPLAPGFAVQIGSTANITNGRIGSYNLIKSTGNASFGSSLNSGGTITLSNSNKVSGSITAQNQNNASGYILQMGSNAFVGAGIDANGSISVSSGTVSGNVTHPSGTTYSGPKPGGTEKIAAPNIPVLPQFPAITSFTSSGTTDLTSNATIAPGNYRDMKLTGNKKITFNGPGDYYFKSIHNTNANTLEFDFKSTTKGNIRIFVDGDVELDKSTSSLKNGGSGSRIFIEVHGKGSTTAKNTFSFNIANGASNSTTWLGTVWAPYAAINIGSGTGSSFISGALWSATQINIQSGVTINFEPFSGFAQSDTIIVPGYNPPSTWKSNDLIGPELTSLCQTFGSGIIPSTEIYRIVNDSVFIEVVVKDGFYNATLTRLRDVWNERFCRQWPQQSCDNRQNTYKQSLSFK